MPLVCESKYNNFSKQEKWFDAVWKSVAILSQPSLYKYNKAL